MLSDLGADALGREIEPLVARDEDLRRQCDELASRQPILTKLTLAVHDFGGSVGTVLFVADTFNDRIQEFTLS